MKPPAPLSAQQLLERGARELERAGVREGRWEAERLLRHALGWSRERLLADPNPVITPEASGLFFQLLDRRRSREPIQYILGTQEFWGIELRVTPAVLAPRPETEGLVEQVLARFRGHRGRIADVGCGSGCIAIALALELPDVNLYATELSPAALAVARENARRLGLAERIGFHQGDLLEPLDAKGLEATLDAVVSNPPYIKEADLNSLEPEVREYEPRMALAGGQDGLDTIRRLVPQAEAALAAGGWLFLEIGRDMEAPVKALLSGTRLVWQETVADLQGIPRVFIARKQ